MDYKELVDRLFANAGNGISCKDIALREAAYTITDLLDRLEWVSVEEKLPDAEEEVRLCCVTVSGYHYQCQGFYVPPGTHRDDSGYSWDWECCEEYDEERDDYLVNPGWYESIHNWDEYSACGIEMRTTRRTRRTSPWGSTS